MYRLVNVSVNPAGRFGAPETEPGPSGADSGVDDELMSDLLRIRHRLIDATKPVRLVRLVAPVDDAGTDTLGCRITMTRWLGDGPTARDVAREALGAGDLPAQPTPAELRCTER